MTKIVVTGMGVVTPLGNNVKDFWIAIKQGKSGVGPITNFDTSGLTVKIAGEVKDYDLGGGAVKKRSWKRMARCTHLAMGAAIEAIEDSNISKDLLKGERTAVVMGNGIGGLEIIELAAHHSLSRDFSLVDPLAVPKMISNETGGNIAIHYGLEGPCLLIQTACSSGSDAIGQAAQMIRQGLVDRVVTGGTEAAITLTGITCFTRLQALSTTGNDTPQRASRPFDKDRDGFVMGEGAGVLLLEKEEDALARGAKIYGEIAGYGCTCDAWHLTAPSPTVQGNLRSMQLALASANLKPEQVDYINAHGTSTPINDPLETKAIKTLLGQRAYQTKISSTKSMTAHLVGAAGAVEAIISFLSIADQFIPPTINLDNPDEDCDLDYVPHKGIEAPVSVVLSNSMGFGGHNASLVLKKYEAPQ